MQTKPSEGRTTRGKAAEEKQPAKKDNPEPSSKPITRKEERERHSQRFLSLNKINTPPNDLLLKTTVQYDNGVRCTIPALTRSRSATYSRRPWLGRSRKTRERGFTW